MSNQVALGNPGTATVWTFNLPMPDRSGGSIVIINESPYGLTFTIPMSSGNLTFRVPADSWRQVTINGAVLGVATWAVINYVNTTAAPLSDVYIECYGPLECPNTNIGVIGRQTNVGNTTPVSNNVTQVINDGNVAPTLVVEGTPTGASASQLRWNNDGSGTFGGGAASVSNAGVFTLPASAVPVASLGAGALPSGVSVPAAQVGSGYPAASLGSGTVPAGVTVPATQIGGGTLPPGVSLPAAQVSGTVANATNATNATTASSLASLTADVEGGQVVMRGVPNADNIVLQSNGFNFNFDNNGGFGLPGPLLPVHAGSLTAINAISGSGSATVNHGLSAAPDAALVNTANGSNSTTFGSGSYTSSTVFIYQFNAQAWKGLVYAS